MKRYLLLLVTTGLILFLHGYVLAGVEIKAEVDKNKLTTDELLTYKLIITSTEKYIPQPRVPKFEGFNIISQAESATVSFTKSKIKNINVYVFILAPQGSGELKIEPSQIKFKGRSYQTEAFDIEVAQGKSRPPLPPQQKQGRPQETPEEQAPQTTL